MSLKSKTILFAALAMLALPATADAQFKLQFGLTDAEAKRLLTNNGFTEPTIVKRSLKKVHVEACKDGKKHLLRLNMKGQLLESSQIGQCRAAMSIESAETILKDQGYSRIDIAPRGGGYAAIACKQGQRYRVRVNKFGESRVKRELGRCQEEQLSTSDISARLRQKGFDRIKFTDDRLPQYVVEVCRNGKRTELVMTGNGKVRDQQQIGKCDPPIDASDLPGLLAERGFDRVELTDDTLPDYKVEACRGGDRVELVMNQYGKIVDQVSVGERCQAAITDDELANALMKQGFKPVFVNLNDDNNFTANICREGQRITASFSRYGQLIDQKEKGDCKMPTLDVVADKLSRNGLSDTQIFVEGCYQNRKVRIKLNQFGEPTSRQQLGKC